MADLHHRQTDRPTIQNRHRKRRRRERIPPQLRSNALGMVVTNVLLYILIVVTKMPMTADAKTKMGQLLPVALSYHTYNEDVDVPYISSVACAGENFNGRTSYQYRSCQFQNICWNVHTNEFLLFASPEEIALQNLLNKLPNVELITISSIAHDTHRVSSSTTATTTKKLSLGTVQLDDNDPSLASSSSTSSFWFPTTIIDTNIQKNILSNGHYQLASDNVMFPIRLPHLHSKQNNGIGEVSLLWFDFFAIYTVLSMFGFEQTKYPIFIIHPDHDDHYNDEHNRLLSLPIWSIFGSLSLKVYPNDTTLLPENSTTTSNIICSNAGVAGLGMIATVRDHRHRGTNTLLTHSMGRGAIMYSFRQYILSNLGLLPQQQQQRDRKPNKDDNSTSTRGKESFQITISGLSDKEYQMWEQELRSTLRNEANSPSQMNVVVRKIHNIDSNNNSDNNSTVSFKDAIAVISTSMVHITNKSAIYLLPTATCLPSGATLIVLDTTATSNNNRMVQDYLEMAGYFNLHWIRIPTPAHHDEASIRQKVGNIIQDKFQSK